MKDNCLDIGIIQAFLDCELDHAETARVSSHVSMCNECAMLLAQAEDESAVVFSALEREFNTLVPTQRLWNKINDSIETERENRPFWEKALAALAAAFASPSLVAAAGLLIVVGVFALVWTNRNVAPAYIGRSNAPVVMIPSDQVVEPPLTSVPVNVSKEPRQEVAKAELAAYRPGRRSFVTTSIPNRGTATPETAASSDYMPGEESYIKTIASLSKAVDKQKDTVMRPSQRIAYERDMAVVDDSIAKMRNEVKKNPRNESAKQVLYSSYQNKIDLLNSVSQKEELMASLR
jgi:hypothetical protein